MICWNHKKYMWQLSRFAQDGEKAGKTGEKNMYFAGVYATITNGSLLCILAGAIHGAKNPDY